MSDVLVVVGVIGVVSEIKTIQESSISSLE